MSLWTVFFLFALYQFATDSSWGFYPHKVINRMAVFTLPPDMFGFYKSHIEELSARAINADKRRYAVPGEEFRHYIDLDYWSDSIGIDLPYEFSSAIEKTALFLCIQGGDTTELNAADIPDEARTNIARVKLQNGADVICIDSRSTTCDELFFKNLLVQHGILPYHLLVVYHSLTKAFKLGESERILQHSADLGHYLADAHVPLHTSMNYNGQLTGQTGLHAFWETRIPEIQAEFDYNYLVGHLLVITFHMFLQEH